MQIFTKSLLLSLLLLSGCEEKSQEREAPKAAVPAGIVVEAPHPDAAPKAKQTQNNRPDGEGNKSFYYSYAKEANATVDEDYYKSRVEAEANVRSPYERVRIDLLKGRLSNRFFQLCSSCHDDYANGIIGPSLLRRDAEFIYTAMQNYKHQEKPNVLMVELMNNLSDTELRTLADEIATFNKAVRELKEEGSH
ncbi:MAG: hypothetical protein JXK05_06975 [Campylobacterales bacterium]|nr:hypothetical protein [Campylobacterales bacterium]